VISQDESPAPPSRIPSMVRAATHTNKQQSANHVVPAQLSFQPLTPERWPDLEKLFGPRGACGGCWCMTWRLTRSEFDEGKGEGNRRAFRKIVRSGAEPGVLAYTDGEPVGWCAVAPRREFSFLERSRVLAPVDDQPVWSITCLFVSKAWRRRGLSVSLIRAACEHARSRGAEILEAYPQVLQKETPAAFAWTGVAPAFQKAGFRVAARRSPSRSVMRIMLSD
jgi:GNAT superfamily N-acetyltransferase